VYQENPELEDLEVRQYQVVRAIPLKGALVKKHFILCAQVVGEVIDPLDEERKNSMAIDLMGTAMRSLSDAIDAWPADGDESFVAWASEEIFKSVERRMAEKKREFGDSVTVSSPT
jgi:hypothetical protein